MKNLIGLICFAVFILCGLQTCNNGDKKKSEDKQEQTTPKREKKSKQVAPTEDVQKNTEESEPTESFSNDGDDETKPDEEEVFVNENE